jgi:phosphate transport system protein
MPHIVTSFDAELQKLSSLVVEMGATVATQIADAAVVLRTRDLALAKKVQSNDKAVDALQARIEERVIEMIARRQPMAIDLREVIATLKIATDLERMGDFAKNNSKRVALIAEQPQPARMNVALDTLSGRVHEQVTKVMKAYAQRDVTLARQVWESDGAIDTMHTALFRELLTYMMEDPRNIGHCTHLLFCAKNLERIGDHATNIAENVNYIVAGDFLSGERPKGESTSSLLPLEPKA